MSSHADSLMKLWSALPPCDTKTTRIILVRHGRSTFNDQHRYQGRSDDAVLSDRGWHEAHAIGHALAPLSIDAVYASPLKRVRQTTEGILSVLEAADQKNKMDVYPCLRLSEEGRGLVISLSRSTTLSVHLSKQLQEINLPAWEGRCYEEVKDQDAAAYQCWLQRPDEFQMTVEQPVQGMTGHCATLSVQTTYPVCDLYHQAQTFWQEILPRHQNQTLLVVSHGGTNQALLSTALGLSPRFYHRLQQSNGGISILDYSYLTKTAQLHGLNITGHLGESLPKLKAGKTGVRLMLLPVAPECPIAVEAIAQFLADVPIAYSLTHTATAADPLIHHLLKTRPDIVQLQVQHDNYSVQWSHTLERANRSSELITGLAIAPVSTIQSLIADTIGLEHHASRLPLIPGLLSILHYPTGDHPPVLQAINLG